MGFEGGVYWESFFKHAAEAPVVMDLVSGMHTVTSVNIATTYLDNLALKDASTATADAILVGTRAQAVFEKVGRHPERVKSMLRFYIVSLRYASHYYCYRRVLYEEESLRKLIRA